jgi:CRISPR-associated protein Csb2
LPPPGFADTAAVWVSATPFVAPRRDRRGNGRLRSGETPARQLARFLVSAGFPEPEVQPLDGGDRLELVRVHQTRRERSGGNPAWRRPGWRFRLRFPYAVHGPICVGHSAHFGLGLFVPEG